MLCWSPVFSRLTASLPHIVVPVRSPVWQGCLSPAVDPLKHPSELESLCLLHGVLNTACSLTHNVELVSTIASQGYSARLQPLTGGFVPFCGGLARRSVFGCCLQEEVQTQWLWENQCRAVPGLVPGVAGSH